MSESTNSLPERRQWLEDDRPLPPDDPSWDQLCTNDPTRAMGIDQAWSESEMVRDLVYEWSDDPRRNGPELLTKLAKSLAKWRSDELTSL
jgi:hypothetical protein